ncbi:hypothetical protein [Dietzia maris]|uniref:hypothetical protein n=1 Tax=Dietzia maris TaxID=37915 RepID=UPI0037CAA21B
MTAKLTGTMQFGPKASGMMPGETVYTTVGLREQYNKIHAKVTADTSNLRKHIIVGVSAPLTEKPSDCSKVSVAKTTTSRTRTWRWPSSTWPVGGPAGQRHPRFQDPAQHRTNQDPVDPAEVRRPERPEGSPGDDAATTTGQ